MSSEAGWDSEERRPERVCGSCLTRFIPLRPNQSLCADCLHELYGEWPSPPLLDGPPKKSGGPAPCYMCGVRDFVNPSLSVPICDACERRWLR